MKLKTKTGKDVNLDFSDYSYLEYSANGITIEFNSVLVDKDNDEFIVHRIWEKEILLKDSEGNILNIPKEEFAGYKLKT